MTKQGIDKMEKSAEIEGTNALVDEVLFEINSWDHGLGFTAEELVNRLRFLFIHSNASFFVKGESSKTNSLISFVRKPSFSKL